jgi:hypothetical protein
MSVFIDKLNKLTRSEPSPMGFRKEKSVSSARKMQLVALVTGSDDDITGADSVLLDMPVKEIGPDLLAKIPDGVPRGARLKAGKQKDIKKMKDAGCDYVVFSAENTPLALIDEKDIGKVLELDTGMADAALRSVVDLPVDAVFVSVRNENESLTWQDLMMLNRFGGIPKKPLIALVPSKISGSELEALWEAGVMAIVAGGDTGALRKAIDKADFTSIRKRDKNEPVLRRTADVDFEEDDD